MGAGGPGLRGFRGDERAWLFTTARRPAIDESRRRSGHPVASLAELPRAREPRTEDAAEQAMESLGTGRARGSRGAAATSGGGDLVAGPGRAGHRGGGPAGRPQPGPLPSDRPTALVAAAWGTGPARGSDLLGHGCEEGTPMVAQHGAPGPSPIANRPTATCSSLTGRWRRSGASGSRARSGGIAARLGDQRGELWPSLVLACGQRSPGTRVSRQALLAWCPAWSWAWPRPPRPIAWPRRCSSW
jgi:hypothetical protein